MVGNPPTPKMFELAQLARFSAQCSLDGAIAESRVSKASRVIHEVYSFGQALSSISLRCIEATLADFI